MQNRWKCYSESKHSWRASNMRWLILTTSSDRSLSYFDSSDMIVRLYDDISDLPETVDVVYFRDPFNGDTYDAEAIEREMDRGRAKYPRAYYVDAVRAFNDLLIEDKWRQFKLLGSLSPFTWRLDDRTAPTEHIIIKKRISSRARGIFFSKTELKGLKETDYIIQDRLEIFHEYRVYSVCGLILPNMTRKSSKTEDTAVKVQAIEPLREDVREIVANALTKLDQYDLLGFDVAETQEGLVIIEVNRSPQFVRYNEMGKKNIIDDLKHCIEQRKGMD